MAVATAAGERSANPSYATPTLQCDLVMKGGITSGIVYPPAVLELAQKYRFRSIGGTSAGAIAAVVTAAAEFGREQGGFEKLQGLNDWLAQDGNLRDLFQPTREARPLLDLLLQAHHKAVGPVDPKAGPDAATKRKTPFLPAWIRLPFLVLPAALRSAMPWTYWISTVLGLLAGSWVDWILACGLVAPSHPTARIIVAFVMPVGFIGAYVASIGTCAWRLWKVLSDVATRQFFGICTGLVTPENPTVPTLTTWLHERIQDMAGLSEQGTPLTVGALKAKHGAGGEDLGIDLRTITTCLSLGQPYVLPIEDDLFLFNEDDMARIFPAPVAKHLVANARKTTRLDLSKLPGYHVLPNADDIPALVLARMSLSFPILLSAVPLYVMKRDALATHRAERHEPDGAPHPSLVLQSAEADLQRIWFSDGGITSNFPIHFFDAWLPSRPTFGMNLASLPPEPATPLNEAAPDAARPVYLPVANRVVNPPQSDIVSLLGFMGAIGATAQNFRDNTLAALPSYRERIVQIRLSDHEGGLNLAMGDDAIHSIIAKGRTAGDLLSAFDFDQHRWVRLLVFMAQFEHQLLHLGNTLKKSNYELLISEGARKGLAYPRDPRWRAEALERLRLLEGYIEAVRNRQAAWTPGAGAPDAESFFELDSPKPEGVLRVTPRT